VGMIWMRASPPSSERADRPMLVADDEFVVRRIRDDVRAQSSVHRTSEVRYLRTAAHTIRFFTIATNEKRNCPDVVEFPQGSFALERSAYLNRG